MAFRIVIDFPALDRFAAALERYLDIQEGRAQKMIDDLTGQLQASTTELAGKVAASTKP